MGVKATKATAKKVAAKYAAMYPFTIEVDSETVIVWHDNTTEICDYEVAMSVALDIAKALNAPTITHGGGKSIVWYKRAPQLDLDNCL